MANWLTRPGPAAELAEDAPNLELSVGALARSGDWAVTPAPRCPRVHEGLTPTDEAVAGYERVLGLIPATLAEVLEAA